MSVYEILDKRAPEERFKEKIARKYYDDAIAVVYDKGLNREWVAEMISKEIKKLESENEGRHVGNLKDVFQDFLELPEARFRKKMSQNYYHEALQIANFFKIKKTYVQEVLSSSIDRLKKENDETGLVKLQEMFADYDYV